MNGNNGAAGVVPIKEEKEEEEEQPVSKRRKEGRSQKVNKAKPLVKEECEGDASLINVDFHFCLMLPVPLIYFQPLSFNHLSN